MAQTPPVPAPQGPSPAAPGDGLYAYLVESLRGIVWMADAETFRFSYVSPQAEEILGYPAEQWVAEPDFWRAHTHPDDIERASLTCRDATRDGRHHEFEYRMLAADGRVVWLRDIVTVAAGADGTVQLSGIMLDVTERKAAEAALREAEERLSIAQEAGQVGTFAWEIATDRAVFSRHAEALFGLPAGGFTAQAWFRMVHPDDRVEAVDAVQGAMDGGPFDSRYRVVWPDGSLHWLRVRGRVTNDGGQRRILGVVEDVTREKEDEAERARLLHALRERVKELTALHRAAELLGDTRAAPEAVPAALAALLPPAFQHPEVAAARVQLGERVAETAGFEAGLPGLSAPFTTADGTRGSVEVVYREERPAEAHGPFLCEERRLVESVAEMLRTAADRRLAEEALRESEQRYRLVADATHDILYDLDVASGRTRVSETVGRVYGYPPGERSLAWWKSAIHPEDVERVTASLDAALAGPGDGWRAEYRIRRHDGSFLHVLDRGHIVRDGHGAAVRLVGAVMDVTERTQLEEQLRQAQKMEALGRLAAGVAHDFNNLLTVITGYSDFLLSGRQPDDPVRRDVEEIRLAADRASLLTQQLLAFGRKQARHPQVLDLNAPVREVSTMLARLIDERVALEMRLAPDAGAVLADAGQLQQVVINLALNARDAMPAGGTLSLRTREARVREGDARELGVPPGRYAVLEVTDTGIGMSRDVQERIFEPFFTTKQIGRGTGLGLATVHGIVEQTGGHLRVMSQEGRGTTLEVYLPRVGTVPPEVAGPAAPPAAAGTATVLLVEDEDALRAVAVRMLSRSGYRVLAAADSGEALRLARADGEPIDILVTDVVMPGISGPELAKRIEAARPGMKVLFMSGYSGDALGTLEDGVGFIQKPFSMESLAARVREVLDG
jgi:two-component system cell cycle sensor histidine kinase/response regulator CckA